MSPKASPTVDPLALQRIAGIAIIIVGPVLA